MARIARVVAPGFGHHVTERGNRRQQVSLGEDDYRACVSRMEEFRTLHGLRV